MFCQKCGSELPDGAAFCMNCGASQAGSWKNKLNARQIIGGLIAGLLAIVSVIVLSVNFVSINFAADKTSAPSADASSVEASAAEASSSEPSPALEPPPGSYVKFGKYPQNNGDTPEPIEWLVLDNDGETAFLLSKYGLDCQPFYEGEYMVEVPWSRCSLRKWLNGEFLNKAFSGEERQCIADSEVPTSIDIFRQPGLSRTTTDKIFLLSIDEAKMYFAPDTKEWSDSFGFMTLNRERACTPTKFAVKKAEIQRNGMYNMCTSKWYDGNC